MIGRVLLGFAAIAATAEATTIIAVQTASAITLGADSLSVDAQDIATSGGAKSYECKIGSFGGVFWAAQGLRGADFPSGRRFSVDEIAKDAMTGSDKFALKLQKFQDELLPPLKYTLRSLRRSNRQQFSGTDAHAITDVLFATIEDGKTVLTKISFAIRITGANADIVPVKIDCHAGEILTAGYAGAMRDWLLKPPAGWHPTANWVRQMIELEMKSNSDVGGLVAVVTLTKSGSHWDFPGLCVQSPRGRATKDSPTRRNSKE